MKISEKLLQRCNQVCELCNENEATIEYTVSPKDSGSLDNVVALCHTCYQHLENEQEHEYWRILEGSIWHPEDSVKALSYRILYKIKNLDWADAIYNSFEPEEHILQWALAPYQVTEIHKDAYGNSLSNGDTVVLTQSLQVKGTSFTAPKGTIVKKIRLVHDNTEQIEGKINEQVIVILTKYVKKG
jgi:protein PhnA